MTSIAALETRLQKMQEHVERANLTGNQLLIIMAEQDERNAQAALNKALIRDAIHQPASNRCNSGGNHGCTCSACF